MSFTRLCLLLAALAVAACAIPASASAADRAFAARFQTHTRGDVTSAANALLSCPEGAPNCAASRAGTGGDQTNNNWAMANVDVDGDGTTFNSSSASLGLPAGATVAFAGLYWGADSSAGTAGSAAPAPAFANTVLLDTPAAGSYGSVSGSLDTATAIPTRFQGFADVTAQVAAGGAGTYTVANLQAGTGNDRYGGWTLVVAYRDVAQPVRDLSVFDGLVSVANGGSPTVALDGFQTPPSGTVQGKLGIVSWESELGFSGDSARLNGTALGDAANPATNFFNGSISSGGSRVTTKTPDYVNQLGFDSDEVGVNGLIPAASTSATLQLSSTNETYYLGVVTLATDRPPEAPSNSTAPTVSGTPLDGQVLTADPGSWSGTETIAYSYQWQRCNPACSDIPGATGSTYELTAADVGATVQVVVTATNSEGSTPASSAPPGSPGSPGTVQALPPLNTAPPAIGGDAREGETLTAGDGSWSGSGPFAPTYQWQRCDLNGGNCEDIPGATGPTYLPGPDDVGHTLIVIVTVTNPAGSESAPSAPSAVVAAKPPSGGSDPVDGPGQAGKDLPTPSGEDLGATSCQRTRRARMLVFNVRGAGHFRIRVASAKGTISVRRPLRLRALVSRRFARLLARRLDRVSYRLAGRRPAIRRRAPYALEIQPAQMSRARRQVLVVSLIPKRGRPLVAKVKLSSLPCRDLFSVTHRPDRPSSRLSLRVDSRRPLSSVSFRVPRRLLALSKARGYAGTFRVSVAGQRVHSLRMRFPQRARGGRLTLLSGAGRPLVTVRRGTIAVTGLPAGTGMVQLKLRAAAMRRTPRALLRATLRVDGAPPRRLDHKLR